MGRLLRSVTRHIRNAVATWRKYCPKINRKPKIIRSSPVVAIFHCQIQMKTKKKEEGPNRILVEFYCILCNFAPPGPNENQKKVFTTFCAIFNANSNQRLKLNKKVFTAFFQWGTLNFR